MAARPTATAATPAVPCTVYARAECQRTRGGEADSAMTPRRSARPAPAKPTPRRPTLPPPRSGRGKARASRLLRDGLARRALVGLGEEQQRRLHPLGDVLGVGQIELEEDRVDVLLDGALREDERLGDRVVALALGDLGEDLPLAGGEVRERRTFDTRLGDDQRIDDLRVDDRAALRHGADGRRELCPVVHALLEEVTAAVRAPLEQAQRVARVVVLREDDDGDPR